MRRILPIVLLLAVELMVRCPAIAQKKQPDNFTVVRPTKAGRFNERVGNAKAHTSGLSLGIGMHMSFLQNAAFGEQMQRGGVDHDFSFASVFSAVGMRATILPFIIDMSFYSSVPYHYREGITYTEEREVRDVGSGLNVLVVDTLTEHSFRHRGMTFSFSMAAFTFSKVIYPYLGIGYSFSHIGSGTSLAPDGNITAANTSAPFWKVGIAIHPWRKLIITAEYASSINQLGGLTINSGRDFATAEFSLRYQFVKFHKKR